MRKYAVGIAAIAFPAALLWPTGAGFARDWANHVWMVGYFGEYFHQHGTFPAVANTADVGGMTFPIFYGYLFYPLLGLAATHLHPDIVVRGAAVALLAAQYVAVRKTMRRLKAADGLASGAACLVVWSVYGLTNLYSRSAVTEFFAVGVLTCAACAWFDLLRAASAGAAWRRGLRFGLLLTLAMGFHPITGLYALSLFGVLPFALPARRAALGRIVPVSAVAALGAVVVLAPWVYAVRQFQRDLTVSGAARIFDFRDSLDHWRTRLHPLPSDARCDRAAPGDVSTAYLDCQVGLPLLILAAGLAGGVVRRGRARVAATAFLVPPLAYSAAMLYLSLDAAAFDDLPAVLRSVQFLYRLVSYVNIGFLLIPLFALLWAARHRPAGAPRVAVPPVLLCFVLTYAGFCVVLKLQHAAATRSPAPTGPETWADGTTDDRPPNDGRWLKNGTDRARLARLPRTSYGHNDYGTPRALAPLAPPDRERLVPRGLEVETHFGCFGDSRALTVTMDRSGYVGTNVLTFPWNRFEVDGRPVPEDELRGWYAGDIYTAVPVPAGTHTIRHGFEPDRTWQLLRRVGQATLLIWAGVVALGAARPARGRSGADDPGPHTPAGECAGIGIAEPDQSRHGPDSFG
jgi:hypothetical protein